MPSSPATGPRPWLRVLGVLLALAVLASAGLLATRALTGAAGRAPAAGAAGATGAGTPPAGRPATVLLDADFEAVRLADGVTSVGSATGWAGGFAVANPDRTMYSRIGREQILGTMRGPDVLTVFAGQAEAAVQTTPNPVVPGVTYTLTVAVGARDRSTLFGGPFAGATVALQAGGARVAERTLTTAPVPGGFGDVTLAWTAGQQQAGLRLGVLLGIRPGAADGTSTDFDNVRLVATGAGLPVTGLVVSAPADRQVLQRGDDGSAAVPVRGTAAAGGRVEARLLPADAPDGAAGTGTAGTGAEQGWRPVARSGPDGFDGTLPGVPAGWYRLEVRLLAADGAVVATRQVDRVGVGEVFVTTGQSNAANYGRPAQLPAGQVSAPLLGYGGWQQAADPQPNATGVRGSPWPAFGDRFTAETGVPVGVVAVGYGGTAVAQWQPGGTLYPRLQQALAALGPRGFRAVLWHQGESDTAACTPADRYAAGLTAVVTASRRDAGFTVPWGIATASTLPNAGPACSRAVRDGQDRVRRGVPATFAGPDTDGYLAAGLTADGVHLDAAGLQLHGAAWADAVRRWGGVPDTRA